MTADTCVTQCCSEIVREAETFDVARAFIDAYLDPRAGLFARIKVRQ